MYQKCPVCDGTGLVSRPPGIAGDQLSWSGSSCGPFSCQACNGTGLFWFNMDLLDPCDLLKITPKNLTISYD